VDAVEINAGAYYLRQLRADDRIDDRPALVAAFTDAELRYWVTRFQIDDTADATWYVARREAEWAQDVRCSWAVAENTTGLLVGEVGLAQLDLSEGTAEAACWVAAGQRGKGVASTALGAALRFGFGALALHRIDYVHQVSNTASARLAAKCGFVKQDTTDGVVTWHQYAGAVH
jgi:RimJ/RimL family protein N-acetyltransferase